MASGAAARSFNGPAILSHGFRPFFLLGALQAALAVLIWLPVHAGAFDLPTSFAPRDWHVHEMLYGFAGAVVAGFLLTAVPNWTGRLPLRGGPLLVLVASWLAGRLAVAMSAWIGWLPAALIDLSFLGLLAAGIAREIVAGRNWRNGVVLAALVLMVAGNGLFHLEAHWRGTSEHGSRLGIAAILILVMLIGGRIVPSFTRNWLARENPGRMPAPFGLFDRLAMAAALPTLAAWVVWPDEPLTGIALVASGVLQAVRLAHWAGDRTWRDRLVLVLHVAYAFVPLGFVLTGLAAFGIVPNGAGIHAWTGGAFGVTILAVMSRASLGHTGRPLRASPVVQALYALLVAAVLVRICASVQPAWSAPLLPLAGALWSAAFLGFAVSYWAILTKPS